MKLIRGNWIGTPGDWKIGNKKDSFIFDLYWGVEGWGEISFINRNGNFRPRSGLRYDIRIGYENIVGNFYSSSSTLHIRTEKAFRRFIKKRIKPIEKKLKKGTVIELTGVYEGQNSLFYITK